MSQQWSCVRLNQPVLQGLTRKYDIHFNFFLTKPTNEIIYNHPTSIPTINFKDAAILADHNEYLKRYYFLVNQQGDPEITDRILLLADFYANAVLLRHEYPLMILTKTKSIFLKRLKRMKKILVEEGSSDESHSPGQQKAVSINSSCFLRTISSIELERKSFEDVEPLHLDLSLLNDDEDASFYDVFSTPQSPPSSPLLNHLSGFQKELACQLILEPQINEEEVSHLTLDFDDIDREEVIRKYQKLMEKENSKTSGSKIWAKSKKQPMRLKELIERKPMATSITISGLQDQQHFYQSPAQRFNTSARPEHHKHSMIGPRLSQMPASRPQANPIKRSSFFSSEFEHQRLRAQELNQYVIAQTAREDSPKGKHPKFHSGDGIDRYRGYNTRESMMGSPKFQDPRPQQQSFKSRSKIFSQERQGQRPYFPLQYENPQPKGEYPFVPPFQYNYPNRTTSINININNLEDNREGINYRMGKYGEESKEQERQLRAEKKKKIRQKAAALLNRVKSQEYLRTIQEQQDQEYPGYYQ